MEHVGPVLTKKKNGPKPSNDAFTQTWTILIVPPPFPLLSLFPFFKYFSFLIFENFEKSTMKVILMKMIFDEIGFR